MRIKDLPTSEREKLRRILKKDGFSNISFKKDRVEFSQGLRLYELYGYGFDEESIVIDFDFKSFMAKYYKEKVRHSISYSEKLHEQDSITSTCEALGWKITKSPIFLPKRDDWKAGFHVSFVFEVLIGRVIHTITDETVYEGRMYSLMKMGEFDTQTLLSGTGLFRLIAENRNK